MGPPERRTRERVLELVNREPGLHLREVARRVDSHVNLVDYHLRVLEKGGYVVSVFEAGKKGYFPRTGQRDRVPLDALGKRALLMMREPRLLRIVVYLILGDGARSGEVAAELELSPSTATHHLKRLAREGIVAKDPDTHLYHVWDSERAARIIIDYSPGEGGIAESFETLWEQMREGL